MSLLLIGGKKYCGQKKVRIIRILFFFLIVFFITTSFELFSKGNKTKKISNLNNISINNLTPTPTVTPILYPQLFYFKTKTNHNFKFPGLNTRYILSGNNDNNYKYYYVLITSPASEDVTFISYMYEMGEKAIVFEVIGDNTKNAKYNFVRGLLK